MRFGMLMTLGILLMASETPESAGIVPDTTPAVDSVTPPSRCMIENRAFKAGEKVVYKIYYNWNFVWLAAGEVTFEVKDLGKQYHLSVVGKTYPSYEWFYKVEDKYDTFIDKETLLPSVSIRDIHEGNYTLYDKITFDKNRNVAQSMRGRSKEKAKLTEYQVESCMHDILSIIYFTRNLDFNNMEEGAQIPIKIFMDEETWPLAVRYKGKDDKKRIRGMGKFRAIEFSPELISGQYFEEGDEMRVWVSDDKNRLPLLIESPVSVGSVKAVLKEYEGLRYELEAKL